MVGGHETLFPLRSSSVASHSGYLSCYHYYLPSKNHSSPYALVLAGARASSSLGGKLCRWQLLDSEKYELDLEPVSWWNRNLDQVLSLVLGSLVPACPNHWCWIYGESEKPTSYQNWNLDSVLNLVPYCPLLCPNHWCWIYGKSKKPTSYHNWNLDSVLNLVPHCPNHGYWIFQGN